MENREGDEENAPRAEMKSGGRRMDDNGGVRGGGDGLEGVVLKKKREREREEECRLGDWKRAMYRVLLSFCCG